MAEQAEQSTYKCFQASISHIEMGSAGANAGQTKAKQTLYLVLFWFFFQNLLKEFYPLNKFLINRKVMLAPLDLFP